MLEQKTFYKPQEMITAGERVIEAGISMILHEGVTARDMAAALRRTADDLDKSADLEKSA